MLKVFQFWGTPWSPKPQLRLRAQPLHCLALERCKEASPKASALNDCFPVPLFAHRNRATATREEPMLFITEKTWLRWQGSYALAMSKSSFRMLPCSFPSACAVGIVHHMITWYRLQKKQWPNGNPTAFLAQEKWKPCGECLTKCGQLLQMAEFRMIAEFRIIGRRKLRSE